MKKKIGILIVILIIAITIVGVIAISLKAQGDTELLTIRSEEELLSRYEKNNINYYDNDLLVKILGMPFTWIPEIVRPIYYDRDIVYEDGIQSKDLSVNTITGETSTNTSSKTTPSSNDYSTTNIQVENVDEADITKTDGEYIYSISGSNVIITNVKNPEKPVIESRIPGKDSSYPEDMILYNNKLVVISKRSNSSTLYYSSYYSNSNTIVSIYDTTNKKSPVLQKSFELYEPYYTSRCIDNKLYVIASGSLKKENGKIVRAYKENAQEKEIALNNIKYIKEIDSRNQTIFSTIDLNNVDKDVDIKSYLIDISNAYVSQNSFYLLAQKYEGDNSKTDIKDLFGLGGVVGFFYNELEKDGSDYGYKTKIYKFDIKQDGSIEYSAKTKTNGKTINQYSLDEKNGHLRVALSDKNGSRVEIFDEKLNTIGKTENLAKGENMYSSRFLGDRAYLVTYKTIDPLWTIDLSDERNPKVLGELHIPGYSTYLHPYDENHLIGIGMETKETTNRDYLGRVISTSARIVGMKMALFDVSDVNNPKQISNVVIGDSRTTSAILTNPKALLFSKEKQLIAIPVNHYSSDFEITNSDTYSSVISAYTTKAKNYTGEGYLVYKINLEEGLKYKGLITHNSTSNNYNYSYYYTTKMLRGLYINSNLYTVSETQLKVNDLETLKPISEISIKGE